ncbi:MAG TPA: hypothetical protein VGR62_22860 [Candidatus Binatia bacterium]|jgi:hypothetical protein|nr:hypothetical protein [Candidatus Binatia bacterium]
MGKRVVVRGIGALVVAWMAFTHPLGLAMGATDIPLDGGSMRLTDAAGAAGRRNVVGFQDADVTLTTVDPTVTGATASIGRIGVGPVTVLELPASGWVATGNPPRIDFKYKSRTGAVRAARLVDGRSLRLSARGASAYPLGDTPQGEVGVIVEVGEVRFCGSFGGQVTRDDGTRFRAKRATAPPACPLLGTTSTTTSTTTAPSTTTTTIVGSCDYPAGANSRADGCPCDVNADCCGVCGGSVENPICGGIMKPNRPAACLGIDCSQAVGSNARPAGCPCTSNADCCAVCGGSIENPICGGNMKPDPPVSCLE